MEDDNTDTSKSPRVEYPFNYGWLYTDLDLIRPAVTIPPEGIAIPFRKAQLNSPLIAYNDLEEISGLTTLTLQPGHAYEIIGAQFIHPTTGTETDNAVFQIYNETDGAYIGAPGSAHQEASFAVLPNVMGISYARAFFEPEYPTTVSLRYIQSEYGSDVVESFQSPGSSLLVKTYSGATLRAL